MIKLLKFFSIIGALFVGIFAFSKCVSASTSLYRNLLNLTDIEETTTNGVTYNVSNGVITINGTCNESFYISNTLVVESGTYSFNSFVIGSTEGITSIINASGWIFLGAKGTYTFENATSEYLLRVISGYTFDNVIIKPMLVIGSSVPTYFVPYVTGTSGYYNSYEYNLQLFYNSSSTDVYLKFDNVQGSTFNYVNLYYWYDFGYTDTTDYYNLPVCLFLSNNSYNTYDTINSNFGYSYVYYVLYDYDSYNNYGSKEISLTLDTIVNYKYIYVQLTQYDNEDNYLNFSSTNSLDNYNMYIDNVSLTYDEGYNVGYQDGYSYWESNYNNLNSEYTSLQTIYNTLNNNYTSLQTTYNTLVSNYSTLQQQYNDLLTEQYSFSSLFWSISAVPFGVLGSMLNFEVLGINLFGLVTGILTAGLVIWLIKHFIIK